MSRIPTSFACIAALFALPCGAANGMWNGYEETRMAELSLIAGTNAVIDVAEGHVTVIDKISGSRGTITKTGEGVLRITMMRNQKASFNVEAGKVLFDRQVPSVCEEAFFHVDASRADTLELEEDGGTNFVVRWHDVRGNGNYATNSLWSPAWRPNPEKRRAFISPVTQNGLPVVDFGPMLFNGLTNEVGEIQGYGATMTFTKACPAAREVYEVISDTPDVATIAVDYPRFYDAVHGVSFISSASGSAGNYREKLRKNGYPNVFYDSSNNYGWTKGRVYLDGTATSPNSIGTYGKFSAGEGFHVLGFTSRTNDDYSVKVDAFARYYNNSLGGQRLAEYLVFTNRLTAADRSTLQSYLKDKWKGAIPAYRISSLTVADGASVEFAPGVSVSVANVADGSDVEVSGGAFEVNSLNNPDAFFHVDATKNLTLEAANGTNFVARWDDALSNGVYATASTAKFGAYLPDPENRRPFISAETLNGLPVVDFGSLLVPSHTNETGYGVGYGASMKWSSRMTAGCMELYAVMRDTEDIPTLVGNSNVKNEAECGPAFVCDPESTRGWRGRITAGVYPPPSYDNSYNTPQRLGQNLFDGKAVNFKTGHPSAGYHVVNIRMAASGTLFQPQWFAYMKSKDPKYSHGGVRIAEYMIFSNSLSNDVRDATYTALRSKWFGDAKAVRTLRNLSVGDGASVSFPWKNVTVTNNLALSGALVADAVAAASITLSADGGSASGALTVADGATVTAALLAGGAPANATAAALALSGGGTVILEPEAGFSPVSGTYPVLVATGGFSGSLAGWTLDAAAISDRAEATLVAGEDGIYVRLSSKGTVLTVR